MAGDLNGHVGRTNSGYEDVHGGDGFGERNAEGERILEFCDATSMVVIYEPGSSQSQIDHVLVRRAMKKLVKDVKVIAGEECTPQQRLVVGDLTLQSIIEINKRPYAPGRKVWKLKEEEFRQSYGAYVQENLKS